MDVFLSADPWFEITPHEAGFSLIGAFVGTSSFGSQFDKGSMIKKQPEIDMLYLQGNKLIDRYCDQVCSRCSSPSENNNIMSRNVKLFRNQFQQHIEYLERIFLQHIIRGENENIC